VHNLYFFIIIIYMWCIYVTGILWYPHAHIYLPMSLTSAGLRSALLRFIGNMGNLSLLTIGDYYYHKSQNNMVERKWWPDRDVVWVLVGVTGCVPRTRGIAWLHYFSCPCRLRIVHCMNFGQVTDLLSRAHTYLWEREGLLLSYRGFQLFLDQLIGGGDKWRSKQHIEAGPQVWGLRVQVWMGTWNLWQEWNRLVSLVSGVQARCVFFGVPSWAHWLANCRFYMTVWLDYALAP
jgi:hypothetical protein